MRGRHETTEKGEHVNAAEAVANGAQLLDERYPDWYRKIDQDTLEINSVCKCICGQLAKYEQLVYYSDFIDAKLGDDYLAYGGDPDVGASFTHDHGFSSYWGGGLGPGSVVAEWKKAIDTRLALNALPAHTKEKVTA